MYNDSKLNKETLMSWLGIIIALAFLLLVLFAGINTNNTTLKDIEIKNEAVRTLNGYLEEKYDSEVIVNYTSYFKIDDDKLGVYLESEYLNAYVDLETNECYDDYQKDSIMNSYIKQIKNIVEYDSLIRTELVYSQVPEYNYLVQTKLDTNNIGEILANSVKTKHTIILHDYDLNYINIDILTQTLCLNENSECILINANNILDIQSIENLQASELDKYALYINEYKIIDNNKTKENYFEIIKNNNLAYSLTDDYNYIDFSMTETKISLGTDATKIKMWIPNNIKLNTESNILDTIEGYNIYEFKIGKIHRLEIEILRDSGVSSNDVTAVN